MKTGFGAIISILGLSIVSSAAWAGRDLPDIIIPDVDKFDLTAAPPPTVPGHFVPEGVEFLNGFFYLGNIGGGDIFRVHPNGVAKRLVAAGSHPLLRSVFGLDMDVGRRLLHFASAQFPTDVNADVQSAYFALNANNGKIVRAIDLSDVAPNFDNPRRTNDLCFIDRGGDPLGRGKGDPGGSYDVFVTDSSSAQIWRIDQDDNVTTLATDPRFNADPADPTNGNQIGLNGIVCHPDDFLLTVRFGGPAFSNLFRVDLDGTVTEVTVDDQDLFSFTGLDGMFLDGPDTLLITVFESNAVPSGVIVLETDDDWATATIVDETAVPLPDPFPGRDGCWRATTGVIADGDFFVNCAFSASINKVFFDE